MADLDVVAEDLVEAHLQGADAGSPPLPVLELRDPLARAPRCIQDGVQVSVELRPDDAVAAIGGRVFDKRAREHLAHLGRSGDLARQLPGHEGLARAQCLVDGRDRLQRAAQRQELARARMSRGSARHEPLEVAHRFQDLLQAVAQRGRADELIDGREAQLDRLRLAQRRAEPRAQLSRPDGRASTIDEGHQRRQLEVADRRGVERHGRVGRIGPHGQGPRGDSSLVLPQVVEDDARGADGERSPGRADRSRVDDAQHVLQPLLPSDRVEAIFLDLGRRQQLGRGQPLEL